MLLVLEGEVEPDEEGVLQTGEDLLLSTHTLNLLLFDDVTLV